METCHTSILLKGQSHVTNLSFCTSSDSSEQLKSSHSRMICDVLGASPQLTKYDILRNILKDSRSLHHHECQEHDRILANLQVQLVAKHSSLVTDLRELERAEVGQLGRLPGSTTYKEQLSKLKHSKALLWIWNITF